MALVDIGNNINKVVSASQSGSVNAVNKTSSLFVSGVQENLTLVDTKAKTSLAAMNNYKDQAIGNVDGFIKKVTNNVLSISALSSIVDVRNGNAINYDALYKRIGDATGFPLSSIVGLGDSLKKEAAQLADDISNKKWRDVLNAAGIKLPLNDPTWQLVQLVTSITNKVAATTPNSTTSALIDAPAQKAGWDTMLMQLVSAGAFSSIDELLAKYTVASDGINALASYAYLAIKGGDVYTLEYIINKVGIAPLVALNTDWTASILRYFKFKSGTQTSEYGELLTKLLFCLNAANANWAVFTFGPFQAVNLLPFASASANAKTLLEYTELYRTPVAIAGLFASRTKMAMIQQYYPKVAIL